MLGQSELTMLVDPRLPSKIYQGITTEVTGEGDSAAPLSPAMIAADHNSYAHLKINPDWTTFREVFCPPSSAREWASTSPATSAKPPSAA